MSAAAAAAIASAIMVPTAMALLARAFPPTVADPYSVSLDELEPRFAKWEIRFNWMWVALWIPVAAIAWLPLVIASDLVAALLRPADFRMTPAPAFWILPALFLGLVGSVLPVTSIARRLLGAELKDYETYLQLKHRVDLARANRLALVGMGWLVAVMVALGLNWYVLVRSDAFVLNPLFGFREIVHPYSDVLAIETAPRLIAPNGKVVRRREFLIRFRDGSTWSTQYIPVILSESEKRKVLEVVSARSGRPIEELEVFGKWAL